MSMTLSKLASSSNLKKTTTEIKKPDFAVSGLTP